MPLQPVGLIMLNFEADHSLLGAVHPSDLTDYYANWPEQVYQV